MGKRSDFVRKPRDLSGENNPSFSHGANKRGQRTAEYNVWAGIRARVQNPKNKLYSYYGGRGITLDPSWDNFSTFLRDVGLRPSKQHSLDRVDNDGGYSKFNCRWGTKSEQARNKRNNIWIEGQILKDWCKQRRFNYKTVWRWIKEGFDLALLEKRGEKTWPSVL